MEQFNLRQALDEDLPFLYDVSTQAMRPLKQALGEDDKSLDEYKAGFVAKDIEVIQYGGKDVGRLRVVRSPESIYIGGIQILPEFQGNGIGTAVVKSLIEESNTTHVPIVLEVHDVNVRAKSLYEELGFVFVKNEEGQSTLKYEPR